MDGLRDTSGEGRFGFRFVGKDTDALLVLDRQTWTHADQLSPDVRAAVLAYWGPHAGDGATLRDVLALTDDGRLKQHRCRVRATEDVVCIVTGHFGDTLVGVVVHDGARVAEISDGEVRLG